VQTPANQSSQAATPLFAAIPELLQLSCQSMRVSVKHNEADAYSGVLDPAQGCEAQELLHLSLRPCQSAANHSKRLESELQSTAKHAMQQGARDNALSWVMRKGSKAPCEDTAETADSSRCIQRSTTLGRRLSSLTMLARSAAAKCVSHTGCDNAASVAPNVTFAASHGRVQWAIGCGLAGSCRHSSLRVGVDFASDVLASAGSLPANISCALDMSAGIAAVNLQQLSYDIDGCMVALQQLEGQAPVHIAAGLPHAADPAAHAAEPRRPAQVQLPASQDTSACTGGQATLVPWQVQIGLYDAHVCITADKPDSPVACLQDNGLADANDVAQQADLVLSTTAATFCILQGSTSATRKRAEPCASALVSPASTTAQCGAAQQSTSMHESLPPSKGAVEYQSADEAFGSDGGAFVAESMANTHTTASASELITRLQTPAAEEARCQRGGRLQGTAVDSSVVMHESPEVHCTPL
jgi:hypothetical protein